MQTKIESFKEALVNTGIGYVIAFLSTSIILPTFGIPFDPVKFSGITACFTLISVCRTYLVRRWFNNRKK